MNVKQDARKALTLTTSLQKVYSTFTSFLQDSSSSHEDDDTHYEGYEDGYVYGRSVGEIELERWGEEDIGDLKEVREKRCFIVCVFVCVFLIF